MKITFVYPDVLEFVPDYPGHYYAGIGSLSACLREQGHRTSLIHIIRTPESREAFLRELDRHRPDLVAFSSTTLQFSVVETVAAWIKAAHPDLPTLCGGVHPTLMPAETLACPGIDAVCAGEGERALASVCERLAVGENLQGIAGVWVKRDGHILPNPPDPPEPDIDRFPFPDRDLFDYPRLWWERMGTATLLASRGCPFSCNYCCNKALREVYPGKAPPVRLRSVDKVIEEIRRIREAYPFVHSLNFDDDILFLDKAWSRRFAQRYAAEVGMPFDCNIRPNLVNEEVVALMKQARCREVRIGLESGNDRIRNEILNRNLSRDQILKACRLFQEAGISVRTFNIIGIPEETPREVLDTIKINAEAGIDFPQYTVFYPFPGTRLYDLCRERNLLPSRNMKDYFSDTALDLPTLSREHLQMFRTYFLRILQLYRALRRLPPSVRSPLVKVSDSFFAGPAAPGVLKNLHRGLRLTHIGRLLPRAFARRPEEDAAGRRPRGES